MECPKELASKGVSSGRSTGMGIYREIRELNKEIPILTYSATQDAIHINVLEKDPKTTFLSKWGTPSLHEVVFQIDTLLGVKKEPKPLNIFIVHGHNDTIKLELKNYLQNILDLPEPIILHEKPNTGRTIIEKFEDYALVSNLAFILLTPEDKIVSCNELESKKRRARQNVIFEMGFFLGTLGRETGRVILLYIEPLDIPSDISGVVYIDISNGIEAAGEQIRRELKSILIP